MMSMNDVVGKKITRGLLCEIGATFFGVGLGIGILMCYFFW